MVPVMRLVIVEWEDVFKMISDDYFEPNVDIDNRLVTFRAVGWVFKESPKVIMLVQEFDDRDRPHDWIAIPKSLIRKIIIVSETD